MKVCSFQLDICFCSSVLKDWVLYNEVICWGSLFYSLAIWGKKECRWSCEFDWGTTSWFGLQLIVVIRVRVAGDSCRLEQLSMSRSMWWYIILWNMTKLLSCLLRWRRWSFSSFNMVVTGPAVVIHDDTGSFALNSLNFVDMLFCVGDHTELQYSVCGRVRLLYAWIFTWTIICD